MSWKCPSCFHRLKDPLRGCECGYHPESDNLVKIYRAQYEPKSSEELIRVARFMNKDSHSVQEFTAVMQILDKRGTKTLSVVEELVVAIQEGSLTIIIAGYLTAIITLSFPRVGSLNAFAIIAASSAIIHKLYDYRWFIKFAAWLVYIIVWFLWFGILFTIGGGFIVSATVGGLITLIYILINVFRQKPKATAANKQNNDAGRKDQ
jgi:hypothetical protein